MTTYLPVPYAAQIQGWGTDPNFGLIRLFRAKKCLIRLSRQNLTLIRFSRPKLPLIRFSRNRGSLIILLIPTAFWSDHLHTMVETRIQTIAPTLIRLWLYPRALEEVMIRPSCARSIYGQTQLRLQPFMIRLKPAQYWFWSNSSAIEIVWTEKSLTHEQIS